MLKMLCPGVAENKNIVEEHQDEVVNEIVGHDIDECLECCRCIGQSERHHQKFEVTVMSSKGSLLNVSLLHLNLMIPALQI
jgi:hypothetical protein